MGTPLPNHPVFQNEAWTGWAAAVSDQLTAAITATLTAVPEWTPNTVFTTGEMVLNPSGQIVSANAAFTSGSTYNAANWTVVSLTVAGVQALIAAQAASDAATYVKFVDLNGNPISGETVRIVVDTTVTPNQISDIVVV